MGLEDLAGNLHRWLGARLGTVFSAVGLLVWCAAHVNGESVVVQGQAGQIPLPEVSSLHYTPLALLYF